MADAEAYREVAPCCKPKPPALARLDSIRLSRLCRRCRIDCGASGGIRRGPVCRKIPGYLLHQRRGGRFRTTAPCWAPGVSTPVTAKAPGPPGHGLDSCRVVLKSARVQFLCRAQERPKFSPARSGEL